LSNDIFHRDSQASVFSIDPYGLNLDDVSQPLLEAPLDRNWVAAASSALFGAKTSWRRPLPKVGR